ncbi:hypothetical protein T01_9868 [Trichinella spiralis]|uniref:Uncharacterized protein n=1 Tax=Trichinella spiralis TaxID=6334 RepID=A0A0V1C0V5_TRISP|nr:hypothetical protein T01_9868 [Trichinella spiralis]
MHLAIPVENCYTLMNQTAIQSLKKRHKKELLRRVVLLDADRDNLVSQLRNMNLKDCCYMIVQVRNAISGSTLGVSWNKLFGYNENCVNQSMDCDDELYNCNINEEVEKLLTVDDITLFKTLSGDEAVEEDENEVPSYSEAYSCFKVGLK